MKHAIGIIIGLGLLMSAAAGTAQDEIITLGLGEATPHQRPQVVFPHEQHAEAIVCMRCHHDFDEFGTNIGGDEQACAECHGATAGDNPIPLTKAFHLQCKSCHEDVARGGGRDLPVMCGQCHIRP